MTFVWPAAMFRRPRPRRPVLGSQFPDDPFFNDPTLRSVMRIRNAASGNVRHLIVISSCLGVALVWIIEESRFDIGVLQSP